MRKESKMAVFLCLVFLFTMSFSAVGFADTSKAMVAHYTFDGNFKDSSGSGMDGTPVGDVSISNDGVSGQCASFNQGYLKLANGSSFNVGEQYSVAMWVKVDPSIRDSGKTVALMAKLGDPSNGENIIWELYGGPQDMEILQKYKNDTESADTQPIGYIDCDQKWTHLVFENDGQTLYVYVDGKLANSQQMQRPDGDDGALINSSGDLLIGNDDSGEIFSGKIDDLRLYNYVLSSDEIAALANSGSYTHKILLQLLSTTMTVDGQQMPVDPSSSAVYPYTDEGRTMVPIRAIVESMGGTVNWDDNDQRIDISLKSNTLQLWVNKLTATVNGQPVALDVSPKTVDGRTMVPLRFVAENLGAKVAWDGNTQEITLSY